MSDTKVVVVGLGEVGKPLFDLLSECYDVVGVDISPVGRIEQTDILHICYPFQIKDFIGEAARYIEQFNPSLTVINSTVSVGTTRAVAVRTGATVVNSPVRGKHARMLQELRQYAKFVGADDPAAGQRAAAHFESVGLKTKVLSSPEATELAKLTETTYFGLMIAWAQEIERYCDQSGQNYDEVTSFYEEIKFFPPVKYFPGVIGGHCVMPNIGILKGFDSAVMLDAIEISNKLKIQRETRERESVKLDAAVEVDGSRETAGAMLTAALK
jgi:UDP-N-acetyl-D-mannosaminuronate dehydrogenase